jgi:hypothetical protein
MLMILNELSFFYPLLSIQFIVVLIIMNISINVTDPDNWNLWSSLAVIVFLVGIVAVYALKWRYE